MYHSITFWDGLSYYTVNEANQLGYPEIAGLPKGYNTWRDWGLIPSTKPSIEFPDIVTNNATIDGRSGSIDMSEALYAMDSTQTVVSNQAMGGTNLAVNKVIYKDRTGSLDFYVADQKTAWTTIRKNIANIIHGKKFKMVLEDDEPQYYYEGRFFFEKWTSEKDYSKVTIKYQLAPYKYPAIQSVLEWDPFNFETDYDFSVLMNDDRLVYGYSYGQEGVL